MLTLWLYGVGVMVTVKASTDDISDAKRNIGYVLFVSMAWPISVPVILGMVAIHARQKRPKPRDT